jgi:membrane protein
MADLHAAATADEIIDALLALGSRRRSGAEQLEYLAGHPDPLLVAGPTLVRQVLPESAAAVQLLYWPVVVSLSIIFLSLLYHVSIPVRTSWWRQVPGGVLALLIWIVGSFSLRLYLAGSLSGVSVYGSLAAAIAVLAWLYVAALAVLIGAALNAEIDRLWPSGDTARVRAIRDAEDTQAPQDQGATGKNNPG